jgi:predicted DNA-binding transcriptional regulator AlpA
MVSDTERGLLSIKEVSEFVGLPISTIYSQRQRRVGIGALGIPIGRHLRWRLSDIDTWLDAQVEQARAESPQ